MVATSTHTRVAVLERANLTMTEPDPVTASDVRERVVQATIELLAENGPEALQVRRIASAVGVSSMVVYSRFGGMPQLVEAVINEGFRRLSQRFSAIASSNDPIADMVSLALAYHESARENPHLFDLMFGLSTPGGYRQLSRPRRTAGAEGGTGLDEAYRPLIHHAKRAIRGKRIRRQDPERIAAELWSSIHGFTALELGGYFAHLGDAIVEVFAPLTTHVTVGLGDTPQRAAKSIAAAIASSRG